MGIAFSLAANVPSVGDPDPEQVVIDTLADFVKDLHTSGAATITSAFASTEHHGYIDVLNYQRPEPVETPPADDTSGTTTDTSGQDG